MLAGRALLTTLIQSSTVELFRSVGVVVAPMPHYDRVPHDLSNHIGGTVAFAGAAMNGALALLAPTSVMALANNSGGRKISPTDTISELANQLIGRLSNRLTQYGSPLRMRVPLGLHGSSLRARDFENHFAVYGFRTLRGDVIVVLTGNADYSRIVYSGIEGTVKEGDIIFF